MHLRRFAPLSLLPLLFLLPTSSPALQDDEAADDKPAVPEAFRPLAPLIGRWKGQAVPSDNPLRGWRESHEWSYAFKDGEPVGLTLTIEGGKVLSTARLSFDEESKTYRLDGLDPGGKETAFVGPLDPKTNALTLDRTGPEGEDRVTIRPNANGIRSDFWFDRKEPRSPQFARLIRANLGKEGETFAAGGASSTAPQCIVTGGAATITVTAGGSTFSVCCSGCRDEVSENPEKYARKLREARSSSVSKPKPKPGSSSLDDF